VVVRPDETIGVGEPAHGKTAEQQDGEYVTDDVLQLLTTGRPTPDERYEPLSKSCHAITRALDLQALTIKTDTQRLSENRRLGLLMRLKP